MDTFIIIFITIVKLLLIGILIGVIILVPCGFPSFMLCILLLLFFFAWGHDALVYIGDNWAPKDSKLAKWADKDDHYVSN